MSFRPLHDRVLVRRVKEEEKSKGGIIIPDTVKEKPQEGKIVAVGTGSRGEDGKVTPLDVKAATASCSANGRARKSPSTVKSSSS
jgi:chaperonin GroES